MSDAQADGSTIETMEDLARLLAALDSRCPDMARLHAELGAPPLRRRPAGFEGLVHIVTFQQISIAAASDDDFRAAGQSRPKVRTLRAIAGAVIDGSLDLDAVGRLDADAAHAALVTVKGIGPWTADVYLLSCLGHPDAWPAGDIALQAAAGDLLGLGARPDAKAMVLLGERWRPHRAVAARLLWAHYARQRGGRSAEPATTA
jgi:DNA-3-methyladenine glycosylase II